MIVLVWPFDASTQVQAAIVAVIGTLGGALIGGLSSYLVSGRTLQGQRHLARDSALREYRRTRVASVIEQMDNRIKAYETLYLDAYDPSYAEHGLRAQGEFAAEFLPPRLNLLILLENQIPDKVARSAYGEFAELDRRCAKEIELASRLDADQLHSMLLDPLSANMR